MFSRASFFTRFVLDSDRRSDKDTVVLLQIRVVLLAYPSNARANSFVTGNLFEVLRESGAEFRFVQAIRLGGGVSFLEPV